MADPRKFQFDLPRRGRPQRVVLDQEQYPGIRDAISGVSSTRRYHPVEGVRAVVIHATAGASSAGAISVIHAGRASFHWLVPDENEPQHGRFVWSVIPEELAAWQVRNSVSHKGVWGGRNLVNHYSVGIEIVNAQTPSDDFSDWQVESTADLVRYCWSKYPNLRHVVSHARLDPGRRRDPGADFPWKRLKDRVLTKAVSPLPPLVADVPLATQPMNLDGCCLG